MIFHGLIIGTCRKALLSTKDTYGIFACSWSTRELPLNSQLARSCNKNVESVGVVAVVCVVEWGAWGEGSGVRV